MYELKKKIGKVFTSKFVGTGPSSYEKRICRAAVSQRLRNTGLGFKLGNIPPSFMFACSDPIVKLNETCFAILLLSLEQPVDKSTFVSFQQVSMCGFCYGLEHVIYRELQRAYRADVSV